MDAAYRQMRNEALLMLQFARLSKELDNAPALLEVSPLASEGIDALRELLAENRRVVTKKQFNI
jgi:ADP-ribosylation factor-like protein 1